MELSSRPNESWPVRAARVIGGVALAVTVLIPSAAENAYAANPWAKQSCEAQAAKNPNIKCPGKASTSAATGENKPKPAGNNPWAKQSCEAQAAKNPRIKCSGSSSGGARTEASPSKKNDTANRPVAASPWLKGVVSAPRNPRPETVNSGPRPSSVTGSGPFRPNINDARAARPVNLDSDTVNRQCSQMPSNEGLFYHEPTRQSFEFIKTDGECFYYNPATGMFDRTKI